MPGGKGLGHRHLGELCLKQDQREQAKTSFQRALVHNPRDAEALHHLAEIYLTEGQDLDMAENMARLSVNLRPGHWRSIHLLEKILLAAGRKEEAQALRAWNSGLGRDGG
jgi:Flp pilus assembly protein TadD